LSDYVAFLGVWHGKWRRNWRTRRTRVVSNDESWDRASQRKRSLEESNDIERLGKALSSRLTDKTTLVRGGALHDLLRGLWTSDQVEYVFWTHVIPRNQARAVHHGIIPKTLDFYKVITKQIRIQTSQIFFLDFPKYFHVITAFPRLSTPPYKLQPAFSLVTPSTFSIIPTHNGDSRTRPLVQTLQSSLAHSSQTPQHTLHIRSPAQASSPTSPPSPSERRPPVHSRKPASSRFIRGD
jgi:hypothetical protein